MSTREEKKNTCEERNKLKVKLEGLESEKRGQRKRTWKSKGRRKREESEGERLREEREEGRRAPEV